MAHLLASRTSSQIAFEPLCQTDRHVFIWATACSCSRHVERTDGVNGGNLPLFNGCAGRKRMMPFTVRHLRRVNLTRCIATDLRLLHEERARRRVAPCTSSSLSPLCIYTLPPLQALLTTQLLSTLHSQLAIDSPQLQATRFSNCNRAIKGISQLRYTGLAPTTNFLPATFDYRPATSTTYAQQRSR